MQQAHARKTDPASSHLAAADNQQRRESQYQIVSGIVKSYPGCTSHELATKAMQDRYMIARRLSDAEKHGLVRRGAMRKCAISQRESVTWHPAK